MNCGLINWWNSLGTGEEEDFRASNAQGIFFCFSELFEQSADQLCVVPIPRSFNGRLTGLRGHQTTSLSLIAGGGGRNCMVWMCLPNDFILSPFVEEKQTLRFLICEQGSEPGGDVAVDELDED